MPSWAKRGSVNMSGFWSAMPTSPMRSEATASDDTVGTLLVLLRRPAVTARLEVDYRSPALLHREMRLEAWAERIEGRKLHLAATVHDGETLVAEGRALFLTVSLEHF